MLIPAAVEDFSPPKGEAKAERRKRKEMARFAEDRVLDSWERYRTLSDHCKMLLDLTELYDRRSRFALLILGGLNALNLLLVVRADLPSLWEQAPLLLGSYAVCYVLLSLGLLAYAISVLKPWTVDATLDHRADRNDNALYLADISPRRSVEDYCERWQRAQIGQVNRELSVMAFRWAATNAAKLGALDRVYFGLYVLAALTAALFVALGFANS